MAAVIDQHDLVRDTQPGDRRMQLLAEQRNTLFFIINRNNY